ncbi:MAG: hypothetical protein U0903_12960 [Planctomycetales bacterium]
MSADELARVNRLVETLEEREKQIPYVALQGEREITAAKDYNAYFADAVRLSEANRKGAAGSFPPATPQPKLETGYVLSRDTFVFSAIGSRLCRVDLHNGSPERAEACHCFDGEQWQISDGLGNTATQVRISRQAGVSPFLYGPGLLGNLWGLAFNYARQVQGAQQSMSEFLKQELALKRLAISPDLVPEVAVIHPEDVVVSCFIPGENVQTPTIHLQLVIRFDSKHGFAPAEFFLQHVVISTDGKLSGATSQEYSGRWGEFVEVRPKVWLPAQLTFTERMKLFIPEGWKYDTTTKDAWKKQKGETRAYAVKQERYLFRDIAVSDMVPASICPTDYRPGTKVADMESKLGYELTAMGPAVNNNARRASESIEPAILTVPVKTAQQTQTQPGVPAESMSSIAWLAIAVVVCIGVGLVAWWRFSSGRKRHPTA